MVIVLRDTYSMPACANATPVRTERSYFENRFRDDRFRNRNPEKRQIKQEKSLVLSGKNQIVSACKTTVVAVAKDGSFRSYSLILANGVFDAFVGVKLKPSAADTCQRNLNQLLTEFKFHKIVM